MTITASPSKEYKNPPHKVYANIMASVNRTFVSNYGNLVHMLN